MRTSYDPIGEVKNSYIVDLMKKGQRLDNRKPDQYREIAIVPNCITRAEGSALVRLGGTQVLAGVKMSVMEPYSDQPANGTMVTNVELVPVASPLFEARPPGEVSIELARVVDRGIRESHMIDMSKLCIKEGEEVWSVAIDLHVLDYDGNLTDCSSLAAVQALLGTQIPKHEKGKVIYGEYTGKLPTTCKPMSCTFAKVGGSILLDPSLEEEKAQEARLTVSTADEFICAMQKSDSGTFEVSEIESIVDMAFKKGKELRKNVK
jgi:exosome complex component RRP42